MPGYEIIGAEELSQLTELFTKANGVLFRHGFDQLRNGIFKVREFENRFGEYIGRKEALAVTSGTAALKVAIESLALNPGDEIITQAFTFVATVEAIIEADATPVICDIDETLNMDPSRLEGLITEKTKAVIVVHMLGVPADLESIKAICEKHGLKLIEDTAWGLGGSYKGRKLGGWSDIATFSFDYAKVITTGEGGMIVTDDVDLAFRASAYHDHGHENNPNVPRWEDTRHSSGFNYRMCELQAAVGIAQLQKLDEIVNRQRAIKQELAEVVSRFKAICMRRQPPGAQESADALVFITPNHTVAAACRKALLAEGLSTKILPEAVSWHFAKTWSHMKPLVARHGGDLGNILCDSEQILSRCVALPINLKIDVAKTADKIGTALSKAL